LSNYKCGSCQAEIVNTEPLFVVSVINKSNRLHITYADLVGAAPELVIVPILVAPVKRVERNFSTSPLIGSPREAVKA
jgi:hypothetical protein